MVTKNQVETVRVTLKKQKTWPTWGPKPTMTMEEVQTLLDYIDQLEAKLNVNLLPNSSTIQPGR